MYSGLMLIQFHSHGTTNENGPHQLDNYSLIPSNLFINLIDETTNYWKCRMKKKPGTTKQNVFHIKTSKIIIYASLSRLSSHCISFGCAEESPFVCCDFKLKALVLVLNLETTHHPSLNYRFICSYYVLWISRKMLLNSIVSNWTCVYCLLA